MDDFEIHAINVKNGGCIYLVIPHPSQTSEGGVNMECVTIRYIRLIYVSSTIELGKEYQKPS